MRFHELHEKHFMPYWRSTVHMNDEQAVSMHFIFLSQILGTVPIPMPKAHWKAVRSHRGMRVLFNGKLIHPKLHLFVIGGSGSGKGAAQKSLEFLFTTFNVHEFAKRYNVVEPFEDTIWQALEKHEGELRKSRWERKKVRAKIGDTQDQQDLSEEASELDDMMSISERKDEFKEIFGNVPKEQSKDTPFAPTIIPVKPYKMTENAKREIKEAFELKSGDKWSQFTSKNYHVWPAVLKKNTSTTADLIGGFDTDKFSPGGDKNTKLVWVPGFFQTHALIGYDEARSILTSSDSDAYGLLCGALDDEGAVETKARKDRDEYGNVIAYQTCSSMVAGTTEFGDLSSFVAMGGFLQRFILNYRRVSLPDMLKTAHALAHNKNKPSNQWAAAKDYYNALTTLKINYGNVEATDAARDKAYELVHRDYKYFGDTLGYGNHTYNIAITFLNRRTGYYFKAAAIMAALDGLPESTPEHFEAVYEMLGKPWSRSIAEYLENCSSPSQIAESERKYKLLNAIMRARVGSRKYSKGESFVSVDLLAKDIAAGVTIMDNPEANKWVSENKTYHAVRRNIEEWADNHPDTVTITRNIVLVDGKPYVDAQVKLNMLPDDVRERDTAIARDDRDKRVADQGGVTAGWGDLAAPARPVEVHDEDEGPPDNHEGTLDEIRKKKNKGG